MQGRQRTYINGFKTPQKFLLVLIRLVIISEANIFRCHEHQWVDDLLEIYLPNEWKKIV